MWGLMKKKEEEWLVKMAVDHWDCPWVEFVNWDNNLPVEIDNNG